jgi:hypothetical protein
VDKAKQDCATDLATFCSDIKPGGGRQLDCLKKQAAKLTSACQGHVQHYSAAPAAAK